MINKSFRILLVIVLMIQTSSCFLSYKSGTKEARKMFKAIILSLENKDKDRLKKLLAPALFDYVKSEDIDTQIDNAFEFFKGYIISYPLINGVTSSEGFEDYKQEKLAISPGVKNVQTSVNIYKIGFHARVVCLSDRTTEGLWFIEIVDKEGERCEVGYVPEDYD